jgi:hypothetical protein
MLPNPGQNQSTNTVDFTQAGFGWKDDVMGN